LVNWIENMRRRKLGQWALVYVTAAWLFLEIFAFVADRFGWQETLNRKGRAALRLSWGNLLDGRRCGLQVVRMLLCGADS
jgi:hypothetical protein